VPDESTDLAETIASEAALPLKSESDGQSAEGHRLTDLIAADKHLAAKKATGSAWGRVKMARAVPPGTVAVLVAAWVLSGSVGAVAGPCFDTVTTAAQQAECGRELVLDCPPVDGVTASGLAAVAVAAPVNVVKFQRVQIVFAAAGAATPVAKENSFSRPALRFGGPLGAFLTDLLSRDCVPATSEARPRLRPPLLSLGTGRGVTCVACLANPASRKCRAGASTFALSPEQFQPLTGQFEFPGSANGAPFLAWDGRLTAHRTEPTGSPAVSFFFLVFGELDTIGSSHASLPEGWCGQTAGRATNTFPPSSFYRRPLLVQSQKGASPR
jgi:hypothetical protein